MAGLWTITRGRPAGTGEANLRAAFGRVRAWSRRALLIGPAVRNLRPGPAQAVTALAPSVTALGPAPPDIASRPPAFPVAPRPSRPARWLPRVRIARPMSARVRAGLAVPFLALMTAAAIVLAWATVQVAERGVNASRKAAMIVGGPLVMPAPRDAGGFPRRFGPITDPAAKSIVTEFRHRFGAVGAGLVADARRAADPPGTAQPTRQITGAWTSGLYGEPGHLDPSTYRPSWVMYVGMDATGALGRPAEVVARLMTGLLGPYAVVGPWRVTAGHRGGSANCTVAWLAQTSVSVCGWATDHTIGALVSPVSDTGVRELAAMLTQMRYDLQRA